VLNSGRRTKNKRGGGIFPHGIHLAALLLAVFASAAACRADTTEETGRELKTLSLRTPEGMLVADCPLSLIPRLTALLREESTPLADNRSLFLWLIDKGIPADSIRIYVSETRKPDTGGLPDMKWKKTTVGAAARDGEIPDITGRELYEAYMIIRATGAEVYLDENTVPRRGGPGLLPHTVFVFSSGYLNGQHAIFVDGADLSKDGSSYNIVAFSPDGSAVAASENFNLFQSPENGRRMSDFLNAMPEGTVVLVSIKSGPGVFLSPDAVRALRAFGSGVALDPEVLSSHAMIGKKGWASGAALETTAVNMGSSVIYFEDRLFVDPETAGAGIAALGGQAVILSGAAPDSPISIFSGE